MIRGRGLYAILDVDAWRARGVELSAPGVAESIADALLLGGAGTLQLRAKEEPSRVVLELLRRLAPRAREHDVPLVANDRVDLALISRVEVVHVGRDDLPLADVRALAPSIAVGVSTHDRSQLDEALAARPSYVAFGPVFGTTSKRAPDPVVGLSMLHDATEAAKKAGVPLVAIGGITRDRARSIVEEGVRWAAVIGDLVAVDASGRPDLDEVAARARSFAQAFEAGA